MAWTDPDPCPDTSYRVVLNDEPHVYRTQDTWQRLENILPGTYNVSVMAENDQGHSEYAPAGNSIYNKDATDQELVYMATGLTPVSADDIIVHVGVDDDNKIYADISWTDNSNLDPDVGAYLVTVNSPDLNTIEDKLVHRLNVTNIRIKLSESHPLAQLRIQTRELGSESNMSEPVRIFE